MNKKDFADIIRLVRRAPLNNMNEAEYVAKLLQRFSKHASEQIEYTDRLLEQAKEGEGADQPKLQPV